MVNHYCTYFDARYAAQGMALWLSLRRVDATAVLWVLALDEHTNAAVEQLGQPDLRAVPLSELEAADPELSSARENRSWVEYVFTLSPCLPRFLLTKHSDITVITYVDADMAFFSSSAPLFAALGKASVLIVEHRFPPFLGKLDARGRFNVGVQCFRNDANGRAVLEDWRARCLEWCYDRVEPTRFADQKYLDAWPRDFAGVTVCMHPGVNLAPWNWMTHRCRVVGGAVRVDGLPLVVFHFARLRPLGLNRADSGQLEYGVMPLRLRTSIYGYYWGLLQEARVRLASTAPGLAQPVSVARGRRAAWKTRILEIVFGSTWRKIGPWWISEGIGPGTTSGRALVWFRRVASRASRGSSA
jgi:hypothetical protein